MLTAKETQKLIEDVVRQVNVIIEGLVERIEKLEAEQKPKPGRPRKTEEKEAA